VALPDLSDRAACLRVRRHVKMARSPHAYMRGNTRRYYEWLAQAGSAPLPQGPPVWICGDCHSGNLGPVAAPDGRIKLQIRDFDQTVIGNPAHDVLRLALSLATAARGSRLPGIVTMEMLEHLMLGYCRGVLNQGKRRGLPAPAAVEHALDSAASRSWKDLARERIDNCKPSIPLGRNFWPLLPPERRAIENLFLRPQLQQLVTRLQSRSDAAPVDVLDAAYWVKGCSSLGLLRYAVLVRVDGEDCLIDIKEAARPAAPGYQRASMPRDNGKRVLSGARHMSPALGERMVAARLLDKAVFVRELRPQDMKLEIEQLNVKQAGRTAQSLAYVVGRAHGRQLDRQGRKQWAAELQRGRAKSLNVPAWLWTGVTQLLGAHEGGYLKHCRSHHRWLRT
jgi:uncharacterized protein (DUF2252 family)